MKKASKLFTDNDKQTIAAAITKAEAQTDGEIVPVVATMSGRYDRAEDIFGMLTAVVALVVYWLYFPLTTEQTWNVAGPNTPLWPIIVILLAGFLIGAVLSTYVPALRLLFITKNEMREQVERRALETFQRQRIRATEKATGVLIYVSLFEHMVHVVGDDQINAKVDADDWQHVVDSIVSAMKKRNATEGLITAIGQCGRILREHFPGNASTDNELSNHLVLLD